MMIALLLTTLHSVCTIAGMPAAITNQSLGDSISREFGVHLAGGHMADPPPIDNVLTTGPKHKPSALTAKDTAERQREEKRLLTEQPRDIAVVNAKQPVKRRRRAPTTLTVLSTNTDHAALLRAIAETTGQMVMVDAGRRTVEPRPTAAPEAADATVDFASSSLPSTIAEERGQIAAALAMGETSLQLSVSELALLSIAYTPNGNSGVFRFETTRSFASWMLGRQVAQLQALGAADPSASASSSSSSTPAHAALRVDAGRSSVAARSETKASAATATAAADDQPVSPSAQLVLTSSPLRPSATAASAASGAGELVDLSLFPSPVVIPVTPQSPPPLEAVLNLPPRPPPPPDADADADVDAYINITSGADLHRKHARRASRHHSQRVSLAT